MENEDPDLDDFKPSKRRPKKQLGEHSKRFKDCSTDEEVSSLVKGYVPDNTRKNTAWALKVFTEWRFAREEKCPEDVLTCGKADVLNYWLPRFVNEARKADGSPYPPRTINQILAALQRYMLGENHLLPRFLNRHDATFRPIHNACDAVYHALHSSGVGVSVRHTSIISAEEEDKLWDNGILGIDTPKSLQRAIFYYVGKRFCLRGGDEQRRLGPSHFKRSSNPDCLTYVEFSSKNNCGRLKDLRYENKEVPCPAIPEERPKCLVYLFDIYLSKLPKYAFDEDILYLRPKRVAPSDPNAKWYDNVAVGKNTLSTMVKDMCGEADILGKTNHSLRATGASSMFNNDVSEAVIQKVTGHRSLDALRTYERVSVDQHKAVSKVLMTNVNTQNVSVKADSQQMFRSLGGINHCEIGSITFNIGHSEEKKEH